jgi:hypothetical protein
MKDETLFPFLDDISEKKQDLLRTGVYREEDYEKIAFLVNRGLSQHLDCILYVDEINTMRWLPAQMRYDYLMATISPRERRGKWAAKDENIEEIRAIAQWFGVNLLRARGMRELLRDEQVSTIVKKVRNYNK